MQFLPHFQHGRHGDEDRGFDLADVFKQNPWVRGNANWNIWKRESSSSKKGIWITVSSTPHIIDYRTWHTYDCHPYANCMVERQPPQQHVTRLKSGAQCL